ncbi:hypothetical protein Nepgr_014168 [Nepenthes gracilis]|uniref:Uncharacterized protein n=1 Tax=Nepenthes gracilis TaxID=150966 RepID=A0AAD3XPA2_NEPGR|nr:hypothetical protein Nepgr_014168 [Nepenthes gracilis]
MHNSTRSVCLLVLDDAKFHVLVNVDVLQFMTSKPTEHGSLPRKLVKAAYILVFLWIGAVLLLEQVVFLSRCMLYEVCYMLH